MRDDCEQATVSKAHARRLLAAFGGSLDGWEYTGECSDCGRADYSAHCACGHSPLRFLFWWQHKSGRRIYTGSKCVVTLPGLRGTTIERIDTDLSRLRSEAAAREAHTRELMRAAEVATIKGEVDSALEAWRLDLRARITEWRERSHSFTSYLPHHLYFEKNDFSRISHELKSVPRLKTTHGLAARYRRALARIAAMRGGAA